MRNFKPIAMAAIASLVLVSGAHAQMGPGNPDRPGFGMGPGAMMGPGMMGGRRHAQRMCDPRWAGFAGWRAERMQSELDLNDAQKAALDNLKAASAKAAETMRANCPTEPPKTALDQMSVMEKRMEAMLATIKTMRPTMEGFYNTLNDEQKAKLNRRGPWQDRGWMRWWNG